MVYIMSPFSELIAIDSKLVLKPQISADPWFYTNCSINPYRGCQFDCSYCDGKANYYNIPDFGSVIRSKNNFPKLLEKELLKLGYERQSGKKQMSLNSYLGSSFNKNQTNSQPKKFLLSVGGGVTDCYQPSEKKLKVMRKIIKVLIDFQIPSFFLTKSTLIERDLDLIGELHDQCYASVNFSCAFRDGPDKSIHEPFSPSIKKRFEVLEKFTSSRVVGGVLVMPLLPFISDNDETIEYLLRKAKEYKASYALTSGLTLKPGNREFFLDKIKNHYPNLLEKYKQIFPENNTFGIPKFTKDLVNVTAKAHVISRKYDIYPRIHRYIPDGCNKTNYTLSEHLWYIHYLRKWVLGDYSYILDKDFKNITNALESLSYSITINELDDLLEKLTIEIQYFNDICVEYLQTGESKERKRLEATV